MFDLSCELGEIGMNVRSESLETMLNIVYGDVEIDFNAF